jgi:hypothetical protein
MRVRSPSASRSKRWWRERDLQVHLEVVNARLERELIGVSSREAGVDTREADLAEGRKKLEDTQVTVYDCELTACDVPPLSKDGYS